MKFRHYFCAGMITAFSMAVFACGDPSSGAEAEDQAPILLEDLPARIGGERPAKVHWPKAVEANKAYPVVMLLHGYSVNGFLQNIVVESVERVQKFGYVLIVPEGRKNGIGHQYWNAFPDCCDFEGAGGDDVAYLTGLLEELDTLIVIDRERVGLVGHSNGGYMSYRMACERPDWVRRIAVLAGSMPVDREACKPTAPVSVLHIHGTSDDVVPWADNTEGPPGAGHNIVTRGAEDSVARWVSTNGCDAAPALTERADLFPAIAGDETEISSWPLCDGGSRVEFWQVDGGDHLLLNTKRAFKDRIAEFLVAP